MHFYTSVPLRNAALMYPIIWTRDLSLATRWVPRSGPLACQPKLIQSLHGIMQIGHDNMSTLRPCWPTLSLHDDRRCDRVLHSFHAMNLHAVAALVKPENVSGLGIIVLFVVPAHGLTARESFALFVVVSVGVRRP